MIDSKGLARSPGAPYSIGLEMNAVSSPNARAAAIITSDGSRSRNRHAPR